MLLRRGTRERRPRLPADRRWLFLLGPGDLALGELEERAVELAQALGRDRPLVGPRQVLEDPLLSRHVDEIDAAGLLVVLQARDEPQALVQRLDERAVVVRDLLAELTDDRVCALVHRGLEP